MHVVVQLPAYRGTSNFSAPDLSIRLEAVSAGLRSELQVDNTRQALTPQSPDLSPEGDFHLPITHPADQRNDPDQLQRTPYPRLSSGLGDPEEPTRAPNTSARSSGGKCCTRRKCTQSLAGISFRSGTTEVWMLLTMDIRERPTRCLLRGDRTIPRAPAKNSSSPALSIPSMIFFQLLHSILFRSPLASRMPKCLVAIA